MKTGHAWKSLFLATICILALSSAHAQDLQTQKVAPQARIKQAVDDHQLTTLKGNVSPLARPAFDIGAVSDSQPVTRMLLVLKRSTEQQAALDALMLQQQDKSSPNFHAWLTPEEFGKQFGVADADLQAVTDWLSAQGFSGIKSGPGRMVVEFSGTAGQVRNSFHTELHRFQVEGKDHFANATDLQIPTALVPVVAGVATLHNFRKKSFVHNAGIFRREKSTGNIQPVKPAFTFAGCGSSPCFGIGPGDFAKIYNIPSNLTGQGQNIAIVGRTNINLQDVRDFRTMFGLPASSDPLVILNGPDPGITDPGEEGEADLDVEWAGAVAPKATIKFVVTETPVTAATDGVDLSALYIVENNIAPVMSESFGSCEVLQGASENAFLNNMWQQAAAQGITAMVSTGDNGSAGCDPASAGQPNAATAGLAVSGVASTPFNIAVGGTDFNYSGSTFGTYWNTTNGTVSSAKSYIPEQTWNATCAAAGTTTGCTSVANDGSDLVAASGGQSVVYAKPSWQQGINGMPSANSRFIPDISLFASNGINNSFYIICQSDQNPSEASCDVNAPFQNFSGVGGTSASSPAFAGIMALINQNEAANGRIPRQGNANYILYQLYKKPNAVCTSNAAAVANNACIFYDTTVGNIAVACAGSSPNCSNTTASKFGITTTTNGGSTPAWNTTAGYDLATGLGSINVANLANAWPTASFTASTIALKLNGGTGTVTVAHGASVSFAINVTPTSAGGPVSILAGDAINVSPAAGIVLSGGAATGSTNLLPGGSYSVIARYGGDGTVASSKSNPVNVVISPESSKTLVSFVGPSSTTTEYGSPYVLRVDVTNNAGQLCSTNSVPCPTGTLTFKDNGAPLNDFPGGNTATLNNQGYAEDQPIQLNAGSHPISVAYGGDASYNSSSGSLTITITKATTAASVSGPSSVISGNNITLIATIGSNSNSTQGPTGTVQFKSGSSALGAPVTCTPQGATASAGASCTATLSTTLSALPPDFFQQPNPPNSFRLWIALSALAAFGLFVVAMCLPRQQRGFAYAGVLVLVLLSVGIAGCGGGSSSGGGGGGGGSTRTITAVYAGDTNYAGVTSAGKTITVQ